MRRLAAAAMVVVWMVLPACAQRSAGRGGFSGHSAPAFHGGGSTARGFSGARGGYAPGRATAVRRTYQRAGAGAFRQRPPYRPSPPSNPSRYSGSWRYRRPYVSLYAGGIPYGVSGWIPPYYLGYPDDTGDDESAANSDSEGYDQQADEQGPPPWPSAYDQGPVAPAYAYAHPAPAAENEAAVTLVFKDGRPAEQIHNYILTRDTLYVGDRHPIQIPVDQLDLDATVKANREAGVDFRLPAGSR
jgi:hypothetical protein